jgi:hypothetical protein
MGAGEPAFTWEPAIIPVEFRRKAQQWVGGVKRGDHPIRSP